MQASCEAYLAPGAHTKSTKLCTLLSISSPPHAKDMKNLLPLVPHALSLQYYRDIADLPQVRSLVGASTQS